MTDTTPHTEAALRAGMTQSQIARAFEEKLEQLASAQAALREHSDTIAQHLSNLIIQTATACATCLAEERQKTRPGHNIANAIVDGTGYCNEHLDLVNGRLVPRKSSGLIITGG